MALALIAVVAIGALAASYLTVTSAVVHRQSTEVDTMRAFYMAEAGLADGFHAVRMGRTGQIANEESPAVFGDGLLWVDATMTVDELIRLECTALCGTGRVTLAQVLDPVEEPLGFFSKEDLVIDNVLLVDGFDSSRETYDEAVAAAALDPRPEDLPTVIAYAGQTGVISDRLKVALIADVWYDFAYREGPVYHYLDSSPHDGTIKSAKDARAYFDSRREAESELATNDGGPKRLEETTEGPRTSGGGGLLSTNGGIVLTSPGGEPTSIYGDLVSGPEGTVDVGSNVTLSGSAGQRTELIELTPVELPVVELEAAVRHEGMLPYVIPAGTSGHEVLEIAADAELVLRGPSTVVVGKLILEPGALLTLDTREGNVELFVTTGLDLQPGSFVETTGQQASEVSFQVAEVPSVDGPPVRLEGSGQFYGTVYAPDTEVLIGGDFEIFGGVVARKLQIGAGAQLHFDHAAYEALPIPRIVSWRIIDIPTSDGQVVEDVLTSPGGMVALPNQSGATSTETQGLAGDHDLSGVLLTIRFLDLAGAEREYSGPEAQFDWSTVTEVLEIHRDTTWPQEVTQ